MKVRLLFLFVIFLVEGFGQSGKIDSLKKILLKEPNDRDIKLQIAEAYANFDIDSLFYYANSVLQDADKKNDKENYIKALNRLSTYYTVTGNFDSVNILLKKALSFGEVNNMPLVKAKILTNLAQSYYYQAKFKNIIDTLELAEKELMKVNDLNVRNNQLFNILFIRNNAFLGLGLYEKCIANLYNAKLICDNSNNLSKLGMVFNGLGNVYQQMGENRTALDCHLKSYAYFKSSKDNTNSIKSVENVAGVYLLLKEIDSANFYINLANEIHLAKRDNLLSGFYELKARYFLQKNVKDSVIYYYTKSIIISQQNGFPDIAAASIFLRGNYYDSLGIISKALEDYKMALPIFVEIGESFQIMMVNFSIANIYRKMKNYEKANEYYIVYDSLRDIHVDENRINSISATEIKYETSLKEATIATQQTQLSSERKQKYWLYGGIGSLALVIGGLSYFYNRIKKQKAQIQNQRQEILHNNRNNIQQLISIFSRQAETEGLKENSIANQERLFTLNLLNKLLYENGQSNNANVKDYLQQLGEAKEISSGAVVSIQINTPSITLKSNLLKDIGLIINELTTNSIKYAFVGIEKPLIKINVTELHDILKLVVTDNGNGLPGGFDINAEKTSFGLDFVKDLIEQHHGKIKAYNNEGAVFEIELKV